MEVRVMHMQNVQQEILSSVKCLELQLKSQNPYQAYPPSNAYEQSRDPTAYLPSNAYEQSRNPTAYLPLNAYEQSHNPTTYPPSTAYAQSLTSTTYPPSRYQQPSSSFHHDSVSFSSINTSGLQPSHSSILNDSTCQLPVTASSFPQPIPEYSNMEQDSSTSDPGIVSSARNTTALPCHVPLPSNTGDVLPSSEIPKSKLRSVRDVLTVNNHLRNESSASTLCQRLAKEAIFGKEVMKKCTPSGTRDFPALPQEELFELKTIMFRQFPKFHHTPVSFEGIWKKCVVAIEQACKRLRANGGKMN